VSVASDYFFAIFIWRRVFWRSGPAANRAACGSGRVWAGLGGGGAAAVLYNQGHRATVSVARLLRLGHSFIAVSQLARRRH